MNIRTAETRLPYLRNENWEAVRLQGKAYADDNPGRELGIR